MSKSGLRFEAVGEIIDVGEYAPKNAAAGVFVQYIDVAVTGATIRVDSNRELNNAAGRLRGKPITLTGTLLYKENRFGVSVRFHGEEVLELPKS